MRGWLGQVFIVSVPVCIRKILGAANPRSNERTWDGPRAFWRSRRGVEFSFKYLATSPLPVTSNAQWSRSLSYSRPSLLQLQIICKLPKPAVIEGDIFNHDKELPSLDEARTGPKALISKTQAWSVGIFPLCRLEAPLASRLFFFFATARPDLLPRVRKFCRPRGGAASGESTASYVPARFVRGA